MRASRRSFFKAGSALAVAGLSGNRLAAAPAPAEVSPADSAFDPWVEVHAANLAHNVDEIRQRVGGRPVMAVIKNNGYGLGVVNVGKLLDPIPGVAGLAVVKLHEAMALRDAGIRKPVLLMGPFDERNLADAVSRRIMPMVYTPLGPVLDRLAARLGRPVPLHVCVDTGIGRVGVPHLAAAPFIRELAGHKSVRIQGTMMTFTEDPEFDQEQLRRFQALCGSLENEGVPLGQKHAASSFGLFQRPDAFLDMVRPGMALFGIYSEQQFRGTGIMDLRPAVGLKARVIYVKQLRGGECAGYNRAYVAKSDVWVATLPIGHTDGLPRTAAQGARVRIGGNLYPLIASVSASHCIAEIGAEPRVQIGDVATVFDWQEGSRPEDVGARCGASVYDLTMHLNPLLPRRVLAAA
jgi:alanine racemase